MAGRSRADSGPGWWGQRWLAYVQRLRAHFGGADIPRPRRRPPVHLSVTRGAVRATMTVGPYGSPVEAAIKVHPFTDREWRRLLDAAAANDEVARRLLTGHFGPELDELCTQLGLELFPEPGVAFPLRCTCGQSWDCRHVHVLTEQAARLLDDNPFLWLEVRGHPRPELLAQLRARLADQNSAAAPAEAKPALDASRFWDTPEDPDDIAVRTGIPAAPDALLRLLGPLPPPAQAARVELLAPQAAAAAGLVETLAGRIMPLDQVLRRYVCRIAAAAAAMAAGEQRAAPATAPLPGKPVPTTARLVPEVMAAVRQDGSLLGLNELRSRCPTAAAVPEPEFARAIAAALEQLPAEFVTLAQRYVGTRARVLGSASFRHVVSFTDCFRGDLGSEGDWAHALAAAGHHPPYQVLAGPRLCTVCAPAGQRPGASTSAAAGAATVAGAAVAPAGLFSVLQPDVGDELTLAVADAEQPLLVAALRRRPTRTYTELAEPNRVAAQTVLRHMEIAGRLWLPMAEAVQVLLAERHYRERTSPDPVWLLPALSSVLHLYRQGAIFGISRYWPGARFPFAGTAAGQGYGSDAAFQRFVAGLANRGGTRKSIEAAAAAVERWCRHWRGAQNTPEGAAPLGTFLHFLWNTAPLETQRLRLEPEQVLRALAEWFTFLVADTPALADHYAAHLDACARVAAFDHRRRTAPRGQGKTQELLAWQVEGARWLGAELYLKLPDAHQPARGGRGPWH